MRNPVGPLPSSIYWRRRGIFGAIALIVVLLVLWLLNLGGGGGGKGGTDGPNGAHPAPSSITPGPGGSGPAISQHPGGRDESGGSPGAGDGSEGSTGSAGTGGDGASGGSQGGGDDGAGSGGGTAGSGGAGGSDAANGGGGGGNRLPAGSSLANCGDGSVALTLRSKHNTYAPDEKPVLELSVKNSSGSDCKVDLGPRQAVVTITLTGEDDPYWSSEDCPSTGSVLLRVPAGKTVHQDLNWNRKPSAKQCATPPAGSAKPGTYLVEAKAAGLAKARTSFRLDRD